MRCTSLVLASPTGRTTTVFQSQFLIQNFCFLAGFMHLSYHFLNWRSNFMLSCPLFFLLCFSELLLTFFQYPILWLQNLFFHVIDRSRLSLHNSPRIIVESCVYILGKINSYLIYCLFFPLSILYRPLQWEKCPVEGAAHTRTGLLYALTWAKVRNSLSNMGCFLTKGCFCINFLGHGKRKTLLDKPPSLFVFIYKRFSETTLQKSTLQARTIFWRHNM